MSETGTQEKQPNERSVRVFISGRVQGVWYRDWTRRAAAKRGLSGWVRNRCDGRVEAQFCGSAEEVDKMLEACRNGPPLARVEEVLVMEQDGDIAKTNDFRLRGTI